MIHPSDFIEAADKGPFTNRDRHVMARVALNALFDADQYPVDLGEISALNLDCRLKTRAFLAYLATHPDEYLSHSTYGFQSLFDILSQAEPSRSRKRRGGDE